MNIHKYLIKYRGIGLQPCYAKIFVFLVEEMTTKDTFTVNVKIIEELINQWNLSETEKRESLIPFALNKLKEALTKGIGIGAKDNIIDIECSTFNSPRTKPIMLPKKCEFLEPITGAFRCKVGRVSDGTEQITTMKFCSEGCVLPDQRLRCCHLTGIETLGIDSNTGILGRKVVSALCNIGKEFTAAEECSQCKPGHRDCWTYLLEIIFEKRIGFE